MNKSFEIFKIGLYNVFSLNKFKQKKLIKKIFIVLLIIYVMISIMASMGFFSFGLAIGLK